MRVRGGGATGSGSSISPTTRANSEVPTHQRISGVHGGQQRTLVVVLGDGQPTKAVARVVRVSGPGTGDRVVVTLTTCWDKGRAAGAVPVNTEPGHQATYFPGLSSRPPRKSWQHCRTYLDKRSRSKNHSSGGQDEGEGGQREEQVQRGGTGDGGGGAVAGLSTLGTRCVQLHLEAPI